MAHGPVIVIETPRLRFRPLTVEDADELQALYSDPEVMRFFEGLRSREQVLMEIEEAKRSYQRLGFYLWAAIHKPDRRFIGRCGLLPQSIEGRRELEVAYMLARPYWGRGLGTEAARAIKAHAFTRLHCARLISLIAPGNEASVRVAEKNGMRYVKEVTLNGYVDRMYVVEATGGLTDLLP
jgi:ribosomal-protein-alanine N-acetyltransferase